MLPIAKSTENSVKIVKIFACGANLFLPAQLLPVQNLLSQSLNHIIQLNPNSQDSVRAAVLEADWHVGMASLILVLTFSLLLKLWAAGAAILSHKRDRSAREG